MATLNLTFPDAGWPHWFVGLVDGEGCFCYSGGQARFSILMMNDSDIIQKIHAVFGFGSFAVHNYRCKQRAFWRTNNKDENAALCRFFEAYPLRGDKRLAFETWRDLVTLRETRRRHDPEVIALAEKLSTLNRRKIVAPLPATVISHADRKKMPTPYQLGELAKMGVNPKPGMTKVEAARMLHGAGHG